MCRKEKNPINSKTLSPFRDSAESTLTFLPSTQISPNPRMPPAPKSAEPDRVVAIARVVAWSLNLGPPASIFKGSEV